MHGLPVVSWFAVAWFARGCTRPGKCFILAVARAWFAPAVSTGTARPSFLALSWNDGNGLPGRCSPGHSSPRLSPRGMVRVAPWHGSPVRPVPRAVVRSSWRFVRPYGHTGIRGTGFPGVVEKPGKMVYHFRGFPWFRVSPVRGTGLFRPGTGNGGTGTGFGKRERTGNRPPVSVAFRGFPGLSGERGFTVSGERGFLPSVPRGFSPDTKTSPGINPGLEYFSGNGERGFLGFRVFVMILFR